MKEEELLVRYEELLDDIDAYIDYSMWALKCITTNLGKKPETIITCEDPMVFKERKELYEIYNKLSDDNKLIIAINYGIPTNPNGGNNG